MQPTLGNSQGKFIAGNSGKSMCGSTVCSSSSAVFVLHCRHYVRTRDSTVAVCLTIMYLKSRNSIKFHVIRKYISLFTQATARSETKSQKGFEKSLEQKDWDKSVSSTAIALDRILPFGERLSCEHRAIYKTISSFLKVIGEKPFKYSCNNDSLCIEKELLVS